MQVRRVKATVRVKKGKRQRQEGRWRKEEGFPQRRKKTGPLSLRRILGPPLEWGANTKSSLSPSAPAFTRLGSLLSFRVPSSHYLLQLIGQFSTIVKVPLHLELYRCIFTLASWRYFASRSHPRYPVRLSCSNFVWNIPWGPYQLQVPWQALSLLYCAVPSIVCHCIFHNVRYLTTLPQAHLGWPLPFPLMQSDRPLPFRRGTLKIAHVAGSPTVYAPAVNSCQSPTKPD